MKKQTMLLLCCLSTPLLSGFNVAPNGAYTDLQNYEDTNDLLFENNAYNAGITKHMFEILSKEIFIFEHEEECEINSNCTMYATTNLNIRANGSMDSEILDVLPFNSEIVAYYDGSEWTKIIYGTSYGWVSSKYISFNSCTYTDYKLPTSNGFKSYMSYSTITSKTSSQYLLQSNYSYTGDYGIRQANGRYCVALGTAFNAKIGTYFDLILENGETIPCILGDIKADIHTKEDNITTAHNGCVSEFIVDLNSLYNKAKIDGDISSCNEDWNSPVSIIRIYNKNILD